MFSLLGDANPFLGNSYAREYGGRLISTAREVGAIDVGLDPDAILDVQH